MADDPVGSSAHSVASRGGTTSTNDEDQMDRRKQIQKIMTDASLSQQEKNRAIQSIMDGRRRSMSSIGTHSIGSYSSSNHNNTNCYASSMADLAAHAHDYYSDEEGEDAVMAHNAPEDIDYGYNHCDELSVESSVTQTSYQSRSSSQQLQRATAAHSSSAQNVATASACTAPMSRPQSSSYRQLHGRSMSLTEWGAGDRAAAAASTSIFNNPAQISRLMEQCRPKCSHYERNCTIVAPCCGLAFGCRICHDECPDLPKPLSQRKMHDDQKAAFGGGAGSQAMQHHFQQQQRQPERRERRRSMPTDFEEEEDHHNIDRFAIREVICRKCYTRQSSKSNSCTVCHTVFGEYHCSICNLWMSSKEHPYHCADCGFCRVGGRENFRHCDDCGMCIDSLLFNDHNCKAGKYNSNCPVCQDDLFSSRLASHEMPCGHAIHWHCFKELTSYDTRCPVCKKTAETPEHMASTWSAISMGIALQPVPPELSRAVDIMCYDCEAFDVNRRWHFLGVRCMRCLSFNTNVERIVMQGREAAAFLNRIEADRSHALGVPANIAIPNEHSMDEGD